MGNTNVFTPLQSSPKSAAETLTKLLANGKLRSTIYHLRSMLAKRKQETTTASCSVSKLLGMKPLNKKKTRFSEHNSSLDKSGKRLIAKFTKRKKSLTILAKITNAPWTLFKHHLKPNLVPSLRP